MGSPRLNLSTSEEDRANIIAFAKSYPDEQISMSEAIRRAVKIALEYRSSCSKLSK